MLCTRKATVTNSDRAHAFSTPRLFNAFATHSNTLSHVPRSTRRVAENGHYRVNPLCSTLQHLFRICLMAHALYSVSWSFMSSQLATTTLF